MLESARRTAIVFMSGEIGKFGDKFDADSIFPICVEIDSLNDGVCHGTVTVDVRFSATVRDPRGDTDKVDEYAGVLGPSELQRLRETIKALNELEDEVWEDFQKRAADVAGVMQPIAADRGTSMDPRPPGFEFRAHAEFLKQEFSKFVDGLNLPESVVADRAPITRPASAESIVGGEKQ